MISVPYREILPPSWGKERVEMQQPSLGPPILIMMLAAACWVWWHALRGSERVTTTRRQRVGTAVREGVVCGSVWSGIQMWVQQGVTGEALLHGLLVGSVWAGTAWWSRERFVATHHQGMPDRPPSVHGPVAAQGRHHANGHATRHDVHDTSILHAASAPVRLAPARSAGPGLGVANGRMYWTLRVSYATIALLSGAGAVLFWVLLYQGPALTWSRTALGLQVLAGSLAGLLLIRWRGSLRALSYPMVLAVVIYVWDTTLPPPTLPGGVLRDYLPRMVIVGLLIDLVVSVQHRPATQPRTVHIRAGLLAIQDAAALLGITVDEVRRRLQQTGRTAVRTPDGDEALSLDDMRAITRE